MLQEIPKEENGLVNSGNGLSFAEYKEWLKKKCAESEQIGLVDGWKVPSTTYWLYVDGKPAGFGAVRHFLTDALRKAGGNIGYGIAPRHRGKGYGKKLLGLWMRPDWNRVFLVACIKIPLRRFFSILRLFR